MKARIQSLFIPILALSFSIFVFAGETCGQVSSAAFDPNCYQPLIGTPGVVDTIYGSRDQQSLGNGVKNLGQTPGESYGQIVFSSDTPISVFPWQHTTSAIYESGPNFDLHKLHAVDTFNLGAVYFNDPSYIVKRAHFRSKKYLDLLMKGGGITLPPRIYWADEKGKYDSSRFTELRSIRKGTRAIDYNEINIYSTHLTADSVEDIICGVLLDNGARNLDSIFFLFFKGGESLFKQGTIAIADSMIFIDTAGFVRRCSQGDFRGTGRADLIVSNGIGDIFYFRNEQPFSLEKLVRSIKYDTLMALWQNQGGATYFDGDQFSMREFKKLDGDSSVDFMPINAGDVRIYQGGADFGTHRLFADSADFIIHNPYYYDNQWLGLGFPGALYNCGDMTGTGDPVMCVYGSLDASYYGYYFFYVLGNSMDDKVDMFFSMNHFPGLSRVDTLVADGDKLQDIIMGMPGYYSDEDLTLNKRSVGTVCVVHGSKNIPDRTRSIHSTGSENWDISVFPNPCTQGTVLTFENHQVSKMLVQIIASNGVVVQKEETPSVDGMQEFALDFSTLSAGNYTVSLSCPSTGWHSTVNIVKTGAAVKPWTMNLNKMVGR